MAPGHTETDPPMRNSEEPGKRYAAAFLPAQITSDYFEVYQQVLATTRPLALDAEDPARRSA